MNMGDKNTKFFYSAVKVRRAKSQINHLISSNGEAVTDMQTIKTLAPVFYEKLFNQQSYWNVFLDVVVKKLTSTASTWLSRDINTLEIKEALFQTHPDKAPGLDGFNAYFSRKIGS